MAHEIVDCKACPGDKRILIRDSNPPMKEKNKKSTNVGDSPVISTTVRRRNVERGSEEIQRDERLSRPEVDMANNQEVEISSNKPDSSEQW